MLKKAITYRNLDGVLVTEDFYFQISKADIAEKALVGGEGFLESLENLSVERDGQRIIDLFKKMLGEAVGKREGNLFIKDDDTRKQFMFSGAYDAFFIELLENPDSGASVFRAMLPADAQAEVDKVLAERDKTKTVELPSSGTIENIAGDAGDAEVQAIKPQPDTFPTNLEKAIEASKTEPATGPQTPSGVSSANGAQPGKDDEPVWLTEGRQPTRNEMLKMSKEDLQLVFKMREAGLIK